MLINPNAGFRMRKTITVILTLLFALPLSFILTVIINPVWKSFENLTGIEAFGHSGPAEWCYWFDYVIISILLLFGLFKFYGKNTQDK